MGQQPTDTNKKIWLPLLLSVIMVAGMFIGLQLQDSANVFSSIQNEDESSLNSMELPLLQVVRYIDAKYVDTLDESKVAETAIRNLIHELDPHSAYLPKTNYDQSKEQLSGSFVGIGIDFMLLNDTVTIGGVLKGGPAEIAGLKSGDKIVMIRDFAIAGVNMTADTIISLFKGDKGEQLSLICLDRQSQEPYTADLIREDVIMPSLPAAFMIAEGVGYLLITSFVKTTSREFAQAVKEMIDNQGMKDLIIDLRGNPGGYLDEAVEVLNHIFLDKHKLLVYTSGSKIGKRDHHSNGSSRLNIKNIAVLIDQESASAAEITAGALQDWDRAVIVGRRSFGKGLVQEDMMLANGGAIRMTVARYFTPSGRCIQKDYSNRFEYAHELEKRFENGEVFTNKQEIADTTSYYTAGGRLVHGGGGISPEIYIPVDSTLLTSDWLILNSFAYEFILHRNLQIPELSAMDFLRTFQVSDSVVDEFIAYANASNEKLNFTRKHTYNAHIKRSLKAFIGKFKYGESMFYKVKSYELDPFVQAALIQLQKKDILKVD